MQKKPNLVFLENTFKIHEFGLLYELHGCLVDLSFRWLVDLLVYCLGWFDGLIGWLIDKSICQSVCCSGSWSVCPLVCLLVCPSFRPLVGWFVGWFVGL